MVTVSLAMLEWRAGYGAGKRYATQRRRWIANAKKGKMIRVGVDLRVWRGEGCETICWGSISLWMIGGKLLGVGGITRIYL